MSTLVSVNILDSQQTELLMQIIVTIKDKESVLIGEDVGLRVFTDRANQVKISIDAPDDVLILRQELLDPTKRNNSG